jgi:hypothetical protein
MIFRVIGWSKNIIERQMFPQSGRDWGIRVNNSKRDRVSLKKSNAIFQMTDGLEKVAWKSRVFRNRILGRNISIGTKELEDSLKSDKWEL